MLDRDEVRALVRETVREATPLAVAETFTKLGVDINDPEAIRDLQIDLIYLRKSRVGSDEVIKWTKRAAITTAAGTLVYLLGEGILRWVSLRLGFPGPH